MLRSGECPGLPLLRACKGSSEQTESGPHSARSDEPCWTPQRRSRPSLLERRRGSDTQLSLSLDTSRESCDLGRAMTAVLKTEYDLFENIGQGTTSLVQRATRRSDGLRVAVKRLVVGGGDPELVHMACLEYELLTRLQHPNIIKALELKVVDGHAAMVLELFEGCTFKQAVKSSPQGRLQEADVRTLAAGLFGGLQHLHANTVLHRDVKPQNILVSLDLKDIKLIDFNTAHGVEGGFALTPTGTRLYASPEALAGCSPSEPADVWSAGLCLYYALSGHLPQQREQCETSMSALQEAATREVEFEGGCWKHVSQACIGFLSRCLVLDPAQRPSAAEMLREPWLQMMALQ